jgi:hypothetical protein
MFRYVPPISIHLAFVYSLNNIPSSKCHVLFRRLEHVEEFVHLSMQVCASLAFIFYHAQGRRQSTLTLSKLLIKLTHYVLVKNG